MDGAFNDEQQLSREDREFCDELQRQIAVFQGAAQEAQIKAQGVSEVLQTYLGRKYHLVQGDRIERDGRIVRATGVSADALTG
jgi:hypothetical protein